MPKKQPTNDDTQPTPATDSSARFDMADDRMSAQDERLAFIADGVSVLADQVTTLNERVYTKNFLDQTRNRLIRIAVMTFFITSVILGFLLWRINDLSQDQARISDKRSEEARLTRTEIADCQVPPGVILEGGIVNKGECFLDVQRRTQEYINNATNKIEDDIRTLLRTTAEAQAADEGRTQEQRRQSASIAQALADLPARAAPTPTFPDPAPPAPAPAPEPTAPPVPTTTPNVLCGVLKLIGAC